MMLSNIRYPIRSQCTLSLSPQNIKKVYGFLMFSGGRERVYRNEWVKKLLLELIRQYFKNLFNFHNPRRS